MKAHISATLCVFAEYKSDVSYYQVTLSPNLFSHFSIFQNSSGKMQDFVIYSQSLCCGSCSVDVVVFLFVNTIQNDNNSRRVYDFGLFSELILTLS